MSAQKFSGHARGASVAYPARIYIRPGQRKIDVFHMIPAFTKAGRKGTLKYDGCAGRFDSGSLGCGDCGHAIPPI